MKKRLCVDTALVLGVCLAAGSLSASDSKWLHDPAPTQPFGSLNSTLTDPEARIFEPLIGVHDCRHERTSAPGAETLTSQSVWAWYYDMNGYGVRDLYRYGQTAPASQRIYNAQTKKWHVWYFLGQGGYYAGEWIGGASGDSLVFEQAAKALGRNILSRLEFFDITNDGFEWKSSNIDTDTGETFVDWEISCQRRR